ncbi:MAG: hypothetical protein A3K10_14570 [Bacteroidetes bacterium RIFCSPLOWO2_12_FULL_31_6]|nr:MAG: hypothetical protein A3K10_14570 [Bacteroidetes bacterium RIFCSPLOWO2_12_FULL_31_6]
MSLQDLLSTIPEKNQHELSVKFLTIGQPIWKDYAINNKNLEYTDTVVGMQHKVSHDIIQRTIDLISEEIKSPKSKTKQIAELHQEFRDPIISLQDMDWEVPESVLLIFYSAYNLIESLKGKKETYDDESMIYISINQSIDAITREKIKTFNEINTLLKENK